MQFYLTLLVITSLLVSSASLFGCSALSLRSTHNNNHQPKTLMILVDGLSLQSLQNNLSQLPNLSRYFFKSSKGRSYVGQVTLPSVTYPNISSILTTRPISQHGVLGNRMWHYKQYLNFELLGSQVMLSKFIDEKSVFTQLKNKGKTTVSLAHYVGRSANRKTPLQIESGINYLAHDYDKIDADILESLTSLLEKPYSQWPDFTFVHLISVDAISHAKGPQSSQVITTLKFLDQKLGGSLERLAQVEKEGSRPRVILTSDHGQQAVSKYVDIQKKISQYTRDAKLVFEARFASLYLDSNWSSSKKESWFTSLKSSNAFSAYAVRVHDGKILSHGIPHKFQLGLQDFFKTPGSPDALFFAPNGVQYTKSGKGQHGGLSDQEMYVPVLMRNLSLNRGKIIPTKDLLSFLIN